ncbi:MAG: SDR family oxidoreductase [Acidimicrobiales bacterium]
MILDRFRLDGKVAVVTGSSKGIGAATALALAECGADVVVAARSSDALEEVAAGITSLGRRAVPVTADLSDLANLALLVDAAVSELGRLYVVVNNVGGTLPRAFLDTSPRYLEAALHFNVTVAFELTRLAVPALLATGGGSVVNVASTMGRLADRGFVAYGTAKAALIHLTRLAATDLAPSIRVNVVAPGSVETEALGSVLTEEMKATMISMTPLHRLGVPEDVAAAVVYLVSDAGSFMTGKLLEVDGGLQTPNLPLGLADLSADPG